MIKEELEFLLDQDLDTIKSVIVRLEKGYYTDYIFNRTEITFPWAKSRADCEVEVIHCQKGKNLKLKLLSNGRLLSVFESSEPVETIIIEKR